jgi:biopolymer transport protein ExbD
MNNNFAKATFRSPLKEGSQIRPFGNKIKKTIVTTLALTSLVDAFTILVIYLVVNSSPAEQMDLKDGITLPSASVSAELDSSPVVIFKNKTFFIDNRAVSSNDLQSALTKLKEKTKDLFKGKDAAIVVQADENVDFNDLQPIMVASSYAGISKVKFAVLQKD